MELPVETYSLPKPNSLYISLSPMAGSIHSVVRNSSSSHTISKTIIDLDAAPTLDTTDEIKGTASSNLNVPSSPLLKTQKIRGRIQFAVLCWSLFLLGWNDGCTGPLLPRIQEVYHVGHRDH